MKPMNIDVHQFKFNEQAPEISSEEGNEAGGQEVAIIGISVRLPGSDNWRQFWDHIEAGVDSTNSFPEQRRAFTDEFLQWTGKRAEDQSYMPGAYLEHIDQFDAKFFRMLPTEASLTSPDQRLLLESAWEALEDAGYGGTKLSGSTTGVYIGYVGDLGGYNYRQMIDEWVDPQHKPASIAGNLSGIIASRISYFLDLKGPALIIDTACSSSLVAVHTACQALRKGDCELAIAGGIRLNLLPLDHAEDKVGMESSDGKTRTFDVQSDGAAMGEGVVTVLLKPVAQALQDRDHIYAVIKGSAVNQDGRSIGITAPNMQAQADLYIQAWQDANIDPLTISYIEAHGTGTVIGDPIEIEGLKKAFGRITGKKQFCAIGSLKSNTGHSYQTAGIAGMVKAALALKQGIIPPTLHFNGPNKKIRFTDSPVYVNTTPRKWNLGHSPHRCGVSSFGFSGTNCHLILEEAPIRITTGEVPEVRTEPYLLTLSAGSESGLHRLIHEYEDYLQGNPSLTLEELCYTANTGRGHYRFRLALLVHELSELKSLLSTLGRNGIQGDDIHVFCKNEDGLIPYGAEANLTEQAEKLVEELTFLSHSKHAEWSRLCQLYVNGASIDFDQLYKRHSIHRVPLPTYPFERDVHWLNDPAIRQRTRLQTAFPMESKTGDNKDEAAGGQGSEPLSNQLYYKINWETMPKTKRDSSQLMGKVLVLSNGNPMAELIIERLRNKGESVVIARFGHHFEQTGADSCIVNGSEDDFDQLLHWIGAGEISRVIHMASPSNLIGERSNLSWEQFEQSQAQGTYSLLFLVRSLIHAGCQQRIDISLIADHVHHVNGDEPGLNPEAGALFGLGKVVHTEYDNLRCRAIDMDAATGPDDILEELYLEREYYNVAFRSGNKYMERFSKAELSDYAEMPVKVKDEGAYIITGGTGALGLEAAKYLVERGAAHIALVSRAPLPVREDWNSLLEGEDHNLTAKLRGVMELEAKGAVVSCYSANVSDIHAMNVVMQDIRSQYGLIYGIVHSAGVAGDGFLINKSLDVFNEVYLPKVYGTWILDHLTQGDPLDFFILYSSGASLIGEAGQGDYCAANSYLDAFAAYRSARGQRTQTINWVKWRDIGLAVNKGSNHDGLYKLLATEIAMKALDEILHRDITQIMVGQMNLESQYLSMMELFPFKLAPEIEAVVKRSVSEQSRILESNGSEKNISVTIQMSGREGSSYSEVEMTLATVYQEVLGFKEINVFDNFFELGGNSIMLNLMYARLQKLYPGQLKLTDLFTYTSISRLAEYLTNNNNSSNRVLSKSNEDEKPDISKLLDEMQSGKWSIDQMMEFMK